jgi:diguanylate cyclase (GGDEF)-like protein
VTSNYCSGRWRAGFLLALLAFAFALAVATPVTARTADAAGDGLQLAIAESDSAVALEDILNGRARIGFAPRLGKGLQVVGKPGRTVWLRLRTTLPEQPGGHFLSLPRQGIEKLRLYQAGPPLQLLGESGTGAAPNPLRWPGAFLLPVPSARSGPATWYLEVRGQGYLTLQPSLLPAEAAQAQARTSSRLYDLLYGSLFLIGVIALLRRGTSGERTLRVAAAAFACLVAAAIGNYHLQLSLGGASLARLPALPGALWIMACAPLLWASTQYAGLEKNAPALAEALDRLGFVLLAIAVVCLALPVVFLPQLQITTLLVLAGTCLACTAALFSDPRRWRWAPIVVWLGVLAALAAFVFSVLQWLPGSTLVRRGFQLLLALQLAIYLLLPWIRQALERRAIPRRAAVPEQSAEEKIAHAREWMISSLQAGIEHAADGDMEWIAYRRLMGGLKNVLPQTGAAVIAMNYHNEDLLLAEPKEAEARFQMLLAQRGSLLKNLSRSMAPQQIGVDFTGPEGPLQQVLLAVIPLPVDRPGWGALVIERSPKTSYSDEELDLCTEFAALATTAGDEAAEAMQQRQAKEIDGESAVYKAEMIDSLLRQAHEASSLKRRPLSILRIGLDGFEALAAEQRPELIRAVADLVREEIDYGETIARGASDEFVVLLGGRAIGEAKTLAERILAATRKRALPVGEAGTLQLSLGVAQSQPGERDPKLVLQRAGKALAKARQYGGDQVQAITGMV